MQENERNHRVTKSPAPQMAPPLVAQPLPADQRRGSQRLWLIWAAIGAVIALGFIIGKIVKMNF